MGGVTLASRYPCVGYGRGALLAHCYSHVGYTGRVSSGHRHLPGHYVHVHLSTYPDLGAVYVASL